MSVSSLLSNFPKTTEELLMNFSAEKIFFGMMIYSLQIKGQMEQTDLGENLKTW